MSCYSLPPDFEALDYYPDQLSIIQENIYDLVSDGGVEFLKELVKFLKKVPCDWAYEDVATILVEIGGGIDE